MRWDKGLNWNLMKREKLRYDKKKGWDEMKREKLRWDKDERDRDETNTVKKRTRVNREVSRWDEKTIIFVKTNWVQMRRWQMKRNERRADGTRRGGEARQLERRDETIQ